MNKKNAERMTHTPMGYHQARGRAGGRYIGGGGISGGGTAGGVPWGRGIERRSAPHRSQNAASSSFRLPH